MSKNIAIQFSDEDMLNSLRNFYKENGRTPKSSDFKGKMPSVDMISKRFGKWSTAIELAGLSKVLRHNEYTKEYLINCLFDYYHKYEKVPTAREMKRKDYPTIHSYIHHFGSFKNALIETGLFYLRSDKHQFCDTYTDDELLNLLKKYMNDKDRIPVTDILKKELSPSSSTYDRRFGSVFNALKMIGYDIEKQKEQDLIALQSDMLNKYRELKEILERVPSSRDIEEYSRKFKNGWYSMSSYEFHFGSLYELQILCGFTPTVIGRNKSKQDLLDDLIRISEELERTPSQNDLKYFHDVASSAKYSDEFGSWNEAIKLAGLKPNNNMYYSNGGIECLSYYELVFTNMLEEYSLKFLKEEPYRKYINTNRLYRFDYVIDLDDQKLFVEIFGITCRPDYKEKTNIKINICKENQLNLIEIYPYDFTSYKTNEIYKMFLNKTNYTNNNKYDII